MTPHVPADSATLFERASAAASRLLVEPRRIVVEIDGVAIADSHCALWLDASDGGALFFPRSDVRSDAMRASDRGRLCPRAGLVRYWSIVLDGLTIERAARTCERPTPSLSRLRGFVSFDVDQLDRVKRVRSWLN